MSHSYTIGVDVGGTFTDLFLWSSAGDVEVVPVSLGVVSDTPKRTCGSSRN